MTSNDTLVRQLSANIAACIPEQGLANKLALGRPLVIKLGFDPTAPDLHLGHAVVLRKLAEFQKAGHRINFVIGDFTARVGDPTGRNKTRPPLSEEDVETNAQTYLAQLEKVIDISGIHVSRNSEWLAPLSLTDMLRLLGKITVAHIIQRKDFSDRLKGGVPVGVHELIYPVLQGYDSVMIKADIEIGGADQLLNCLVGKHFQQAFGQEEQVVLTMPLLRGTDGVEKMSKSKGNYVGLTENAPEMFGKIMSIPDQLLDEYYALASNYDENQRLAVRLRIREGENPMILKKELAANIVEQYHGTDAANSAMKLFSKNVQNRDDQKRDYEEIWLDNPTREQDILSFCKSLEPGKSNSDLRRLLMGGGVSINGDKLTDTGTIVTLETGMRVKIGKRKLLRIRF